METPIALPGRTRGEKKRLDMELAEALFVKESLATEEVREWLSVSVIHDYLTGTDGLYSPLLLGAVNDCCKCDGFCSRCMVQYAARLVFWGGLFGQWVCEC